MKYGTIKRTFKIPEWAMCYFVNGDTEGITAEEVKLCRAFLRKNRIMIFGGLVSDSDPYFSHSNDVGGLACNCYDVKCLIWPESGKIFDWLMTPYSCKYGAPMGQSNGERAHLIEWAKVPHYDRVVYLNSGGYDRAGAYWGHGAQLRVRYLHDGSDWQFYRVGQ